MYLFDDEDRMHDIAIEDIVCIKRSVRVRKIQFCTGTEWLHEPNNIDKLLKAYKPYGFYQIDKNKLININKVTRIENGEAWINGDKYPISRRQEPIIRKLLNI